MRFEGSVLHIHIAAKGGAAMQACDNIKAIAGQGLEGDRYALGTGFYSDIPDIREVTLIEEETLIALQRDHDIQLDPAEHRRNLTVRGVPLNHLVGMRIRIGNVVLEGGRLNTPCRYLDKLLGKSVCDSLRHRSGLNCRIVQGGMMAVGDTVMPR